MKKIWKAAAIAAMTLTILGSGCAGETVYVTKPLPLPPRPVLPPLPGYELQCLERETYELLRDRQRERRQYCEELEAIIKGTHGGND